VISAGEILRRIRIKYESESSVRWSDEDIMECINEGLDDLAFQTGFFERHVVMPIRPSVQYYDVRGFTPETVLSVTAIYSTSRKDWLAETTTQELDEFNPMWSQAFGDPIKYYTHGIYWVGVWPRGQDTVQGYFWVYFKSLPPHYVNSQSVLDDLPDDYVPALEDYALYEMAAQDGMSDRSIRYWQAYEERKEKLKDFIDQRLSLAQTMRMGEQR